jgi:hypothetical protein
MCPPNTVTVSAILVTMIGAGAEVELATPKHVKNVLTLWRRSIGALIAPKILSREGSL